MNDLELAIHIVSTAATQGFDTMGDAARTMSNDVDAASSAAAGGLDRVNGAAGALDDTGGKLVGGLGAVSAGFELVGLEQYATGLQSAAMAADFFSGVGQLTNLVLQGEAIARVRSTVATAAHTASTVAGSAAAKAAAVGQWALNAALAANPVGLVVLAVVALVAIFVLLYQRNEAVRTAIQTAMAVARTAIGTVVAVVSSLVGWLVDRVGPGFEALRAVAVLVMAAIKDAVGPVFDTVKDVFGRIQDTIGGVMEAAGTKFDTFKTLASAAFDAVLAPVNVVRDAIQYVLDLIAKVKIPSVPGWLGGDSKFAAPSTFAAGGAAAPITIQITVDPTTSLLDPTTLGTTLATTIDQALTRLGRTTVTV